jgi:hypothetical protein
MPAILSVHLYALAKQAEKVSDEWVRELLMAADSAEALESIVARFHGLDPPPSLFDRPLTR